MSTLATWRREKGASVLAEQRASGAAAWRDFPESAVAAAIGPQHHAVAHTSPFVVAGRPVVYFAPDRQVLVVDETAFSDLVAVHVPVLAAGAVALLGAVRPAARAALGDRGVAELLVQADLVHVWAHIEGTAHLVRETSEEGRYAASFIGSHLYFTNVCNEAHFAFDLAIGADGAITVTGR